MNWDIKAPYEYTITNTITGGTALFVFISGFFFHRIFYKSFSYKKFIIKKFINIGVPYVIISSLILITYLYINQTINFPLSNFDRLKTGSLFYNYILSLFIGSIKYTPCYWYIPFIFIIFLFSNIFIKFITINKKLQISITVLLFIIASIIHRPLHNFNPIHSFLYFTPFYLLGILYSQHKNITDTFFSKNIYILFFTCLFSSYVMGYFGQIGNLHKLYPWILSGFDLMIIQKISLIFFLIAFCKKIENKNLKFLKHIAAVSFPIFFIHSIFIEIYGRLFFFSLEVNKYYLIVLLLFLTTFLSSILSANIIKKVLGKNSKYFIGW
ncbi:acyltransferase family protein [Wenyingzhuangia marina]|nr:acyltransferase family protein [Wenyingzhuangia marina]